MEPERPVTCGESVTERGLDPGLLTLSQSSFYSPVAFFPSVICSTELDWGLDPSLELTQAAGVPPPPLPHHPIPGSFQQNILFVF